MSTALPKPRMDSHRLRKQLKHAARQCKTWQPWRWACWLVTASLVVVLGLLLTLYLVAPTRGGDMDLPTALYALNRTDAATDADAAMSSQVKMVVSTAEQEQQQPLEQNEETMKEKSSLQAPSLQQDPPKACLAMIMKNEGPILPRLFESVKGFVSEYCVVDTGSTDDTIEVLKSIDMPGVIVEEPFVNFAVTRNFLLDTCRQRTSCDYLVLLDADMVLKVSPQWDWAKLDGKDVYNFIQISSVEYENVRMVRRTADRVKVVGATHEYYDVPSDYSRGLIPKHLVHIDDVGDGKAKENKFQRDERLLRAELEKQPDNVRTVFYLANTLKDQGKCREAIPFYKRRTTMGGWFAEADYSFYMLSNCYLELHDLDKAREYAELAAFTRAARRAEPLYYLVFYLHRHGHYELAWYYVTLAAAIVKPDVSRALFIANNIYEYWVAYERASLCRYVFPTQHRYCLQGAIDFLNNLLVPGDLLEYYYPDLKVLAQPLSGNLCDGVLRGNDEDASAAVMTLRVEDDGSAQLLFGQTILGKKDATASLRYLVRHQKDGAFEEQEGFVANGLVLPADLRHLSGTDKVIGFAPGNGATMYVGQWRERSLEMKAFAVSPSNVGPENWALFQDPSDGRTTYCITSWYPSIDIGYLRTDEVSQTVACEHFKSVQGVPRGFSFFKTASYGVRYRGDAWFLVQSRRADANVLSIVMLDGSMSLRSYTYPFTLGNQTIKTTMCTQFGISEQQDVNGKAAFLYRIHQDGTHDAVIEEVEVSRILGLVVA